MEKTLFVLRHGKAKRGPEFDTDFDRTLAPRGRRDAPRMGALLREHKPTPELIVSSPAARALTTAELVQAELPGVELRIEEGFYNAYGSELVSAVLQLPDDYDTVLVVGHNPGFEELVDELTDSYKTVLKTCSLAVVRLDADKWASIELGGGKLVGLFHPRELFEAV